MESDEVLFEIEEDLKIEDELHTLTLEEVKNVFLDDDNNEKPIPALPSSHPSQQSSYHQSQRTPTREFIDFSVRRMLWINAKMGGTGGVELLLKFVPDSRT